MQRLRFSFRHAFLTGAVILAGVTTSALPGLAKSHRPARKPVAATATTTSAAISNIPAVVVPSATAGLLPDMTLGKADAPITVVEYASASCPHCAAWNSEVWPQFEKKYVETGKVHYVFRELLTAPQEYALSAFLIGRCAVTKGKNPQDATPYFTVVQSFFAGQGVYYKTGQLSTVEDDVSKKTGMSQKAMQDCVADAPQFSAFMKTMHTHADADHVSGTPTFFVNGKRLEGHDLKDFDDAIADASKSTP